MEPNPQLAKPDPEALGVGGLGIHRIAPSIQDPIRGTIPVVPIWLQVALTLLVPAAGLGGVWLGHQLSAGSAQEQWRRDRLLQFCVDLIAACHEVTTEARTIHDKLYEDPGLEPPYPLEQIQRMQAATATIRLLSQELDWPATNWTRFVVQVVNAAVQNDGTFEEAHGHAAHLEGVFQRAAHDRLTGIDRPLTAPRGLRVRPSLGTKLRTRLWPPARD
jgi:hypothetical protein